MTDLNEANKKRALLAQLLAKKKSNTLSESSRLPKGLSIPKGFSKSEQWFEALNVASPFFTEIDGLSEVNCHSNGHPLINFSSYNYLALANDPRVINAAKDAIDQFGTSVSASRLASGERPIHKQLEKSLASLSGAEDAMILVSGYATNETIIGHLFGAGDLILHDEYSHSSILHGVLASGATKISFAHNNTSDLKQLLQQHRGRYNQCLIVVEGLYSMDGDICDLAKLVALKKEFSCALMVDEAHSIGVLGDAGKGVGSHFEVLAKDVDLWMGTLSKSLASCGGYIAGSTELIKYLRYNAPGFVYSVGMSPANTAAAEKAVSIMLDEPERHNKLNKNAMQFLKYAHEYGLDTQLDVAYAVIPVFVKSADVAIKVSAALFDQGFYVQPAIVPAVPEGTNRLRFFISCDHTDEQLLAAVKTSASLLKQIVD